MSLGKLERRAVEISYKQKRSHLSSVLTTLPTIERIYEIRKKDEPFVLGNSHAALALWVVLEKHGLCNAEEMAERYGTHAERDMEHGVWVSGGSLGQAETVAVGLALADRETNVYLVTSDGACAEGSIWESLRIAAEQRLENLRITVIANGYSALGPVDTDYLKHRLQSFFPTMVVTPNLFHLPEWLQGIDGHYAVMNELMFKELMGKDK